MLLAQYKNILKHLLLLRNIPLGLFTSFGVQLVRNKSLFTA